MQVEVELSEDMCVHTCMHTYIHTYIYTHTQTYTHKHTRTRTNLDMQVEVELSEDAQVRELMFASGVYDPCHVYPEAMRFDGAKQCESFIALRAG